MRKIIVFVLMAMCSLSTQAADWYYLQTVHSSHDEYFFDKDSVVKRGGRVTIWYKSIHDENFPESDGTYSTVIRMRYGCHERTGQVLSILAYDKSGKVLFSSSKPQAKSDIIPGTVGENMLEVACSRNFPNAKNGGLYAPVGGNDIDTVAKNHFADEANASTDAAPANSKWYALRDMTSDHELALMDVNSIKNDKNRALVWQLTISDVPSADGVLAIGNWYQYSCSKNTFKLLRSSVYGKGGKFLATITDHKGELPLGAGSVAENIRDMVCSSEFPKRSGTGKYFPVNTNDPYAAARTFFEALNGDKNSEGERPPADLQ